MLRGVVRLSAVVFCFACIPPTISRFSSSTAQPQGPAIALLGADGSDIANGVSGSLQVKVHFTLSDTPPEDMSFSNQPGSGNGPWLAFAQDANWTLASGPDGTRTVYASVRDSGGNVYSETSASVSVDQTPPGSPVILVEGGAAATNQISNVALSLNAQDAATMQISNCADFCAGDGCAACCNTSAAIPYATTNDAWTFQGCDDGLVTVYARFLDAVGNTSDIAHATITLDRAPPTLTTFLINPVPPYTASALATNSLSVELYTKTQSPEGEALLLAFTSSSTASCAGADFSSAAFFAASEFSTLLLPAGDGAKTVCAETVDAAGNASAVVGASILLDTVPPDAPLVAETDHRTSAPTATLTLTNAASDAAPSSGGLVYQIRGGPFVDWTVATGPVFTFTLQANAANVLAVRLVDAAGNTSTATEITVTNDNVAPTPPYILSGIGKDGTLSIDFLPSPSSDVDHYLLYYGNFPGSYSGSFAPQGSSPVFVPKTQTEIRITGASDLSTVYVALSAVDTTNLEGAKSNEAAVAVYDTASTLAGFVGGRTYDVVNDGNYLYKRTTLGIETFALPALTPAQNYFAPVSDAYAAAPAITVKGQIAAAGGFVYLLKSDRLDIIAAPPLAMVAVGTIAFDSIGQYTNVAVHQNADRTLTAYLTGPDVAAVYDVTSPFPAVLISSASGFGANFAPTYLAYGEFDFGNGLRHLLFTGTNLTFNSYVHVVDASASTPVLYASSQNFGALSSLAAIGNTAFVGLTMGTQQSMQISLPAVVFDGSTLSCAGPGGSCKYYTWPSQVNSPLTVTAVQNAQISGSPKNTLFVGGQIFSPGPYVFALDVSDLSSPVPIGSEFTVGAGVDFFDATANALYLTKSSTITPVSFDTSANYTTGAPSGSFSVACTALVDTDPQICANGSVALSMTDDLALLSAFQGVSAKNDLIEVDMSAPAQPRVALNEAIGNNDNAWSEMHRTGRQVLLGGPQSPGLTAVDILNPTASAAAADTHGAVIGPMRVDGDLVLAASASSAAVDVFALSGNTTPSFSAPLAQCALAGGAIGASAMFRSKVDGQIYLSASSGTQNFLEACQLSSSLTSCTCTAYPMSVSASALVYNGTLFYANLNQVFAASAQLPTISTLGSITLSATVQKLIEAGNYLIALTSSGPFIVDVSDPTQMKLGGTFPGGPICSDGAVVGQRFYCATDGIISYDLASAAIPAWSGSATEADTNLSFLVADSEAVGAYQDSSDTISVERFPIGNIASPGAPKGTSKFEHARGRSLALYDNGTTKQLYELGPDAVAVFAYDMSSFPNLVETTNPFFLSPPSVSHSVGVTTAGSSLFITSADGTLRQIALPVTGASSLLSPYTDASGLYKYWFSTLSDDGNTLFVSGQFNNIGTGFFYEDMIAAFSTASPGTAPQTANFGTSGYTLSPGAMDYGKCTSAQKPCVVVRSESRMLSVIDVSNLAAINKKTIICADSGSSCSGGSSLSASINDVALSDNSVLFVGSDTGLNVYKISDTYAVNPIATYVGVSGGGGYSALFYDDANQILTAAGFGLVDFIDMSTPTAPALLKRLNFSGLGEATTARLDTTAHAVYVQLVNGEVRKIDVSAGYAFASALGGYSDMLQAQALSRDSWTYYARGANVTAFSAGGMGYVEVPGHQYSPASQINDAIVREGRMYVCRVQNPDEGNIGFEIVRLGLPTAHPLPIAQVAMPCDHLAVYGNTVWVGSNNGLGPTTFTLTALDISNELSPQVVTSHTFSLATPPSKMIANGNTLYVNEGSAVAGYAISSGTLNATFTLAGLNGGSIVDLAASGNNLYISETPGFFAIYDTSAAGTPRPKASLAGAFGQINSFGALDYLTQSVGATRVVDVR